MLRKEALLTEAVTHFVVDFACFFLLSGTFASVAEGRSAVLGAGYLIFLILAYGIRPFVGAVLDEYPRFHSQSVGCLLVGIACLLPPSAGWIALFSAAVGSGLFHVGIGGESLAFARGFFARSASVLSTGALGTVLGSAAAKTDLPSWFCSIAVGVAALACFLFSESRKYPRKIRAFRHSVSPFVPPRAAFLLTLFPVVAASMTVGFLPTERTDGFWRYLPAIAVFLGRILGGVFADRFGPRKTAAVSFLGATVCLTVFTHVPWLYCVGLAFISAPVSVTLGAGVASLPSRPHFSFGVWSFALLMGTVPAFFRGAVTPAVRVSAAVLLLCSVVLSLFLYTDHCKTLSFSLRREKGDSR